jgi:predicted  nucleic acid-binding Zn-ribbon protein
MAKVARGDHMDVTSQLLKLFNVEKQIRGLKSRLTSAERFLAEQNKQLQAIDTRKTTLDNALKQLQVAIKSAEGEVARLDSRMDAIKKSMDSAQTNKEYKAFLTEHGTLKAEKDRHETTVLETMTKADEIRKQIAEADAQRAEREKVRAVAAADRDARATEIQGRLNELTAERAHAVTDIPKDTLALFERLLDQRGEDAMAAIEVLDRRRLEFTCGACQMTLTMDAINGLLSNGKLTRCNACGCVLYVEKELAESFAPAARK